jgi:long-subunit acyl-CoA synthetase (AMP-forming)
MTDITPEAVATIVNNLHARNLRVDVSKAADMLEALEAKLDSTLKDRAMILAERDRTFASMLARAEAAEAENARLRDALRWQADQPEAHPFMAQKARAALTTKEQTNE